MDLKLLWKHVKEAWANYKRDVEFLYERRPLYVKQLDIQVLIKKFDQLYADLQQTRAKIATNWYTFEEDIYQEVLKKEQLLQELMISAKHKFPEIDLKFLPKVEKAWEDTKQRIRNAGYKI